MGLIVLDSSVVIALLDPNDIHHNECLSVYEREKNESNSTFFISTITLAESLVGAIRNSYEFALQVFAKISEEIGSLIDFKPETAWQTASIRSSFPISFADAAIVATAHNLKAELWSCDKKMIRKYKKVKYLGQSN